MNYYYIAYAYSKGFGGATFQSSKFLDLKAARQWIQNKIDDKEVTIVNWTAISKEQFEAGI